MGSPVAMPITLWKLAFSWGGQSLRDKHPSTITHWGWS